MTSQESENLTQDNECTAFCPQQRRLRGFCDHGTVECWECGNVWHGEGQMCHCGNGVGFGQPDPDETNTTIITTTSTSTSTTTTISSTG